MFQQNNQNQAPGRILLLLLRLATKAGQVPIVHTAGAQFMLLEGKALHKTILPDKGTGTQR